MPRAVQVQCPAKVNLFLEVTGRRRDGYHTLATLFAKINLFDVIDVEEGDSSPQDIRLEIVNEVGQPLSAGPDNLALRAAESFRKNFKIDGGVRICLTKRIPMGAGLAGGSSDAAGMLLALVKLYGMERERGVAATLRRVALSLGADVPFFLRKEAMCLGRGVGEKLRPVNCAKSLPWMVLVFPALSVSTHDVFTRLRVDDRRAMLTRLSHLDKLLKKLEKGRPISEWEGLLFNRLEQEVLPVHPEVRQAKAILKRLGLRSVLMSGSGSSVFGFAASHVQGEHALKRLRAYPWKAYLTCCLG